MSNFNGTLRKYIDIIGQLDERITINPDGTTSGSIAPPPKQAAAPGQVTSGSGVPVTSSSGAPVTSGTAPAPAAPAAGASPWANDPAKDAAWKALSPEDQKWLGGADPTDPAILARAPKKGAKATPAAAPAAASALPAGMTQAQVDQAKNAEEPDAVQAVAPATAAANGVNAAGQNVTTAGGINPETGAPTTVTTGSQAARPKVPAKSDPAVQKIQQDLIAKGAKIKADGVMGPATQAAMKQFGQGAKPAPGKAAPAAGAPSMMGASDPMTGMPYSPMPESVYKEDQALARIISLARG